MLTAKIMNAHSKIRGFSKLVHVESIKCSNRFVLVRSEEFLTRNRYNVELRYILVLHHGWQNQPSSGTMRILLKEILTPRSF